MAIEQIINVKIKYLIIFHASDPGQIGYSAYIQQ